ncbi:MAG: hypothetical protein QMC70_03945 [Bacteroidia bacterium]|jgi:hypothetical protein|tara:strand:+ start:130 stop:369 length:240 start_codon:yes stop_codon:yes gene_type:complete
MKLSFTLSIIISLLIGCLSFGEETDFEINSKEGIKAAFRILKIDASLIEEVHYHRNEADIIIVNSKLPQQVFPFHSILE